MALYRKVLTVGAWLTATAGATTCKDVKATYQANQCCAETEDKTISDLTASSCWTPAEGPISSVFPTTTGRPHIIMGVDVDYPPYAYLAQQITQATDLDEVIGVGADMVKAMGAHCGFDVTVIQAHWSDCWGNNEIGPGLLQGWYHGCMTYTHAAGVRNRYLEFSNAWAIRNKPSGLITKLTNGVPHIHGSDTLSGRTIVDVTGWAPTADTLYFVENKCTNTPYTNFTVVQSDAVTVAGTPLGNNDKALLAVLEGVADAMWVYGDQAKNYHCDAGETQEGWDCDLWNGFGTTFAYVQNGMLAWMHNGTTVSISKKGSGLATLLDACLDSFLPTREFYEVCKKDHNGINQLSSCVPNSHFLSDPDYTQPTLATMPYMFPTSDYEGTWSCSTGYCACSE